MSKSKVARAGDVTLNGKWTNLPGVDNLTLEDGIVLISSSELTLHTAQNSQDQFVAPCNLEIIGALVNLTEAPGTATGNLIVGRIGDLDAYAPTIPYLTTDSAGLYEIALSQFDGAETVLIDKGSIVCFGTDGGSTTTGKAAIVLVCKLR